MNLAGLPNKFPTAETKKLVGLMFVTFKLNEYYDLQTPNFEIWRYVFGLGQRL